MLKNRQTSYSPAGEYIKTLFPSFAAIIILFLVGDRIAKGFISLNNISSILMTGALLAIASVAQNTVVIGGGNGIDLSLGAIASFTALICPTLPMDTIPQLLLAVLAALVIGALFGSVNGFFISRLKMSPLIITLIMSSVVSGVVMVLTRGQPSAHISDLLKQLSSVIVSPVRVLTLIGFLFVIVSELVLHRTRAGKMLLLVGDNLHAAQLCGINVTRVVFFSYVASGAIAGLLGLMIVGYAGSTTLNMAESYTLLSLAAITIGGTNLSGGKGSLLGGALGAVVLIQMTSILQALNMDQGMRQVIQGCILIVIIIFNTQSQKSSRR